MAGVEGVAEGIEPVTSSLAVRLAKGVTLEQPLAASERHKSAARAKAWLAPLHT